jgi:hypothetical protein
MLCHICPDHRTQRRDLNPDGQHHRLPPNGLNIASGSEIGIDHRRNCASRMHLVRHARFQASAAWFVDFLSAAPRIHGDCRLRRGRCRGRRLPDRPGDARGTIHGCSDWDKRNFQPFDQCFSYRAVVSWHDRTSVSAPLTTSEGGQHVVRRGVGRVLGLAIALASP